MRDFDAARAERARLARREPLRFRLGGKRFRCVAQIPLGVAFDLMDVPADVPDSREQARLRSLQVVPENYAQAARALAAFTEEVLANRWQKWRWRRLLRRRRDPIDDVAIIELGVWLAEVYAANPFDEPSGSSDGQDPSGETSSSSHSPPSGQTSVG